jgi:hypothetical protein
MAMSPFAINSTLQYGNNVIVGDLPPGLNPDDYTCVQGTPYTVGIGPPNIFGFHCGPTCEGCKSIPPCPPHDPPLPRPPATTLSIYIKSPVEPDGNGYIGVDPARSRLSNPGNANAVLAQMNEFAARFAPQNVVFHAYTLDASAGPGLANKILLIPVNTRG